LLSYLSEDKDVSQKNEASTKISSAGKSRTIKNQSERKIPKKYITQNNRFNQKKIKAKI